MVFWYDETSSKRRMPKVEMSCRNDHVFPDAFVAKKRETVLNFRLVRGRRHRIKWANLRFCFESWPEESRGFRAVFRPQGFVHHVTPGKTDFEAAFEQRVEGTDSNFDVVVDLGPARGTYRLYVVAHYKIEFINPIARCIDQLTRSFGWRPSTRNEYLALSHSPSTPMTIATDKSRLRPDYSTEDSKVDFADDDIAL
mmetsp:Transcript_6827/g.17864  ORF Transcript_6827/g.17864 Transcript_6827/m.17864 type:complete len:197 (+) Transcript_6827:54-644(+)